MVAKKRKPSPKIFKTTVTMTVYHSNEFIPADLNLLQAQRVLTSLGDLKKSTIEPDITAFDVESNEVTITEAAEACTPYWVSEALGTEVKRCTFCSEIVKENDMRDHAMLHTPQSSDVPWEVLATTFE